MKIMKKTQILAMFVMMTLLSSFMSIGAQTQRIQTLRNPGTSEGKIGFQSSIESKKLEILSRFGSKSKAQLDGSQGTLTCYDVTNTNDDTNLGSLRYAIENSDNDCNIEINTTGTVFLQNPLVIGEKSLRIAFTPNVGANPDGPTPEEIEEMSPDQFIVDASQIDDSATKGNTSAFQIYTSNVALAGFTITGGRGTYDGDYYNGGAIFTTNSILQLTTMTVRSNTADFGGAIYARESGIALVLSSFYQNTARVDGGAFFYQASTDLPCIAYGEANSCGLAVLTSTISNNTAGNRGGGIYANGWDGGGLFGLATATLISSTVAFNEAPIGAGIAARYVGNLELTGDRGMGTGSPAPVLTMGSTIVAKNNPNSSGSGNDDIKFLDDATTAGEEPFNLIGRFDDGGLYFDPTVNILGTTASPIDPQLEALADNGGPTKTLALSVTSVAIDRGVRFIAPFDQRFEFASTSPTGPTPLETTMGEFELELEDIGAYEYQFDEEPSCDLSEAVTYSQGGGSSTSRNAPMTSTFFNDNFGSGLVLGSVSNNRSVTLTSATAVTRFLPNSGTAAIFKNGNLTNPTNKTVKNVLAGQTAAAMLNYARNPVFADAELATGVGIPAQFEGVSIGQIIDMGNNALGNVSGPYSKTYLANLAKAIEYVNLSFHGGMNQGFVVCSEGSGPTAR
jgi:predicted outer membrane repeat protein